MWNFWLGSRKSQFTIKYHNIVICWVSITSESLLRLHDVIVQVFQSATVCNRLVVEHRHHWASTKGRWKKRTRSMELFCQLSCLKARQLGLWFFPFYFVYFAYFVVSDVLTYSGINILKQLEHTSHRFNWSQNKA